MSRFLFIGPDHPTAMGGREQLARLHRAVLGELRGDAFDTILLPRTPLSGTAALRAALSGRINGTEPAAEARILAHIAGHDVSQVWLDGSNLGVLAKAIKCRFPRVEVFTFFHNIEPRFFLGALRERPGLRAAGVFAATFAAERKAARYSDRLVVLNARDRAGVQRWHRRRATDILPMALDDSLPSAPSPAAKPPRAQRYLLFVGGTFYANKAGIAWFAREVAPHIAVDTLVVGSGMETERAALERFGRVKVIGRVDALAPYYRDALAVIAPIFDGSGMKTKVAEAWMHGKHVIGTSEAFTGYEQVAAVKPCDDAASFVAAIGTALDQPPPPFDPALRKIFDANYSRAAVTHSLARMIASPPPPSYPVSSSAPLSPPSP